MKYTKEQLLADNGELALRLAGTVNKAFADSKFAHDYDVVSQYNGRVALLLSWHSNITKWVTYDLRILKLFDGWVAANLAMSSKSTGWHTEIEELLNLNFDNYSLRELLNG